MIQQEADPVQKLSIIPRGRVLGVARSTPEQDLYGYDADYLPGRIIGDRGGSAAEALIFGVTSWEPRTTWRTPAGPPGRWSADAGCPTTSGLCPCCPRRATHAPQVSRTICSTQ